MSLRVALPGLRGLARRAAAVSRAPLRHRVHEDLLALVAGCLFVALGLVLFRAAGLVTGGTAGIALLAHHVSGVEFGLLFFCVNLPFYLFSWRRQGLRFVLRTLCAVTLLALLVRWLPQMLRVEVQSALVASVAGGLLAGTGMLILFRHGASLGGVNALVLYLQDRGLVSAGRAQLVIDTAIVLLSAIWLDGAALAASVLATAVLNLTLALNHRPGRYAGL